jgi:hypothetical protein
MGRDERLRWRSSDCGDRRVPDHWMTLINLLRNDINRG